MQGLGVLLQVRSAYYAEGVSHHNAEWTGLRLAHTTETLQLPAMPFKPWRVQ